MTTAPSPADMTVPIPSPVFAQVNVIATSDTMLTGTAFGYTAHGCPIVGIFTMHSP